MIAEKEGKSAHNYQILTAGAASSGAKCSGGDHVESELSSLIPHHQSSSTSSSSIFDTDGNLKMFETVMRTGEDLGKKELKHIDAHRRKLLFEDGDSASRRDLSSHITGTFFVVQPAAILCLH